MFDIEERRPRRSALKSTQEAHMQKRRVISVVIGAVLCLGAFGVVLNNRFTKQADKEAEGAVPRISAEAVVTTPSTPAAPSVAEIAPEGNVRPTLPKPVYTAPAMRRRSQAPPPPVVVPKPYVVETIRFDTPIPKPWEPPPIDQR
jgi:hypothetical protein